MHLSSDVSKDDSGVIDLLAIHNKAKAEAAASVVPPPVSAPPPAFTMDLSSTPDLGGLAEMDELAFADTGKKKKIGILVGAAAGCVGLIAILASLAGSSEAEATKAAASPRPREAKTEVAPPAAATTSIPVAAAPPPPVETAPVTTPAPPSTGSPVKAAPARRAPKAGARAPTKRPAGGPKLTKVQSSGV